MDECCSFEYNVTIKLTRTSNWTQIWRKQESEEEVYVPVHVDDKLKYITW